MKRDYIRGKQCIRTEEMGSKRWIKRVQIGGKQCIRK